jgi:GNAT superfamily N-acetyltransferase
MSSPDVRPATAADRDPVVATVLAAFADDPAFRFFFPDRDTYQSDAAAFVGHLFDGRLGSGTVWVVDDGAAVAMWNPPGADVSADLPGTMSAAARERLDRYDGIVHRLFPAEPHWYLGILATHPHHAGKKWGRLAMAPGLERARQAELPAYLETVTATNEGIYTAAGWTVVDRVTVDGVLDVRVMAFGLASPRPARHRAMVDE